jgi:hypothetical protein
VRNAMVTLQLVDADREVTCGRGGYASTRDARKTDQLGVENRVHLAGEPTTGTW